MAESSSFGYTKASPELAKLCVAVLADLKVPERIEHLFEINSAQQGMTATEQLPKRVDEYGKLFQQLYNKLAQLQ